MTGTPSKFLTNLVTDIYTSLSIILGFGLGVATVSSSSGGGGGGVVEEGGE